AEYLDWGIHYNGRHNRAVREGRGRCDRALLCLAEGSLEEAERHLARAEALFQPAGFARGLADVQSVRGRLRCGQGRFGEAPAALRLALGYYDGAREQAEAARVQRELARTLLASGAPRHLVAQAFLNALERAEACRRTELVGALEEELKGVDEEA